MLECFLWVVLIPGVLYGYIYFSNLSSQYFVYYVVSVVIKFQVESFVLVIAFLMVIIYPYFIAPLFNKFQELEEGTLKSRINLLAEEINFPLSKILIMDASKRTAHSNAYLFGFWKGMRVVLYDTLFKKGMTDEEVLAIVGHELGHWKLRHNKKNFVIFSVLFFKYLIKDTNYSVVLSF